MQYLKKTFSVGLSQEKVDNPCWHCKNRDYEENGVNCSNCRKNSNFEPKEPDKGTLDA